MELNNLILFCDKLKEKRQNNAQRLQAQLAVKLYFSALTLEAATTYPQRPVEHIREEIKGGCNC